MKILLTNDDGLYALGIIELAKALFGAGHELLLAAPKDNQSCVSHGLTLRRPLHAERAIVPGLERVRAYAIDGTPSDCVRLALGNLDFAPDVVVSGINDAPNLGTDAVYSGTVSAAIEAYMVGVPGIAVAKDTFTLDHMDDAARNFAMILPKLMTFFGEGAGMLSVNIPSADISEYRGVRVARTQLQSYDLRFDERMGEDGRIEYFVRPGKLTVCDEGDMTDERAMREGFVVITPLTYDITEYSRLEKAKALFESEEAL
jgi:5'-nucleotidase